MSRTITDPEVAEMLHTAPNIYTKSGKKYIAKVFNSELEILEHDYFTDGDYYYEPYYHENKDKWTISIVTFDDSSSEAIDVQILITRALNKPDIASAYKAVEELRYIINRPDYTDIKDMANINIQSK